MNVAVVVIFIAAVINNTYERFENLIIATSEGELLRSNRMVALAAASSSFMI